MNFRLGKKPASYDKRDLLFAKYRNTAIELPVAPSQFGHEDLITDWGLLGNNSYGDCVWAGGAHETMLWNKESGTDIEFTDQSVLSDYSAVTGFDPNNLSTDEGTDVRVALNYRKQTGLLDASGQRHKISGYVALEPGNWQQLIEATYLFSVVGIGIQFPQSAMDQFNAGQDWIVVPGASIEGGHYVPVVGHLTPDSVTIVTWGKLVNMTSSFYQTYCDEAFALLSEEFIGKSGKSLEGFDFTSLQADLADLND